MDWFQICSDYYADGFYDSTNLKVFVEMEKITADQYTEICGEIYTI